MRPILLFLAVGCMQMSAQVVLRVNDSAPVTITAEDLAKLPRHSAVLNDHGKQVHYEGVLLQNVLARGGIDFGKGLRGKQMSTYVAVLASDGYEAVFALADLDPTIGNSGILVADQHQGQPLGEKEGPLRIIVPHDQRPARSVRLVREIDVVQLQK